MPKTSETENESTTQVDAGIDDSPAAQDGPPAAGTIDLKAAEEQLKAIADGRAAEEARQGPSDDPADAPAGDSEARDPASAEAQDQADGDDETFRPTDEQLAMAKQIGVPDDEIRTMTETQAEAFVLAGKAMSRKASSAGRKKAKAKAKAKAKDGAAGDVAGGEDGQASSDRSEMSFDGDEDWGTESGANKINDLVRAFEDQGRQIESLQTQLQERTDKQTVSAADDFFDGLDSEIFPDAGDEGFQTKVLKAAAVARKGFADQWGQELTDVEALEKGLALVDADGAKAAAQAPLKKELAERKKQLTSRPTQRQTTGRTFASPQHEAAANIVAAAQAAGIQGVAV